MTIQMFIGFFSIGSAVSALLTQAVKKGWPHTPSNLIAFIVAIVVGGAGTAVYYILADVAWDLKSIVCLILMMFLIWIGSMVGYDKVKQLFTQLKKD